MNLRTLLILTIAVAGAVAIGSIMRRDREKGLIGMSIYDPLCDGDGFSGDLPPEVMK